MNGSSTGGHGKTPKTKKGLWIGLIVVLVIIAVIMVIALVVPRGEEEAPAAVPTAPAYVNPLEGAEEANPFYVNPFKDVGEKKLNPNAPAENPFSAPAPTP